MLHLSYLDVIGCMVIEGIVDLLVVYDQQLVDI